VIAEIVPEAYDAVGRQVSEPFSRRKSPHPTFPIGRYVSQPLTIQCSNISELRKFLARCKYVSDKELFGKEDYWQPPEDFEKRKKGDCEDFALWTWRQLLAMGYDARFIGGSAGRYGSGHAWVEYLSEGKWYLLEPQYSIVGEAMPRLLTLRYEPRFSVSWDGAKLRYFAHRKRKVSINWKQLVPLVSEYLVFWIWFWIKNGYRLPKIVWNVARMYLLRRELWTLRRKQHEQGS
jgi:hypothetical protein